MKKMLAVVLSLVTVFVLGTAVVFAAKHHNSAQVTILLLPMSKTKSILSSICEFSGFLTVLNTPTFHSCHIVSPYSYQSYFDVQY